VHGFFLSSIMSQNVPVLHLPEAVANRIWMWSTLSIGHSEYK